MKILYPHEKMIKKIIYTMTIALFLFLVITLLIPYLKFTFQSTDISKTDKNCVLVIAHRGASGYAPENTLASFSKAIEMNADILELDVHLTSDDSVMVMHDYNVKRTTNGKGEIESMSFDEIRKLDAGSWFDAKYKDEKVPTLNEVLALVNGRKKVLIELKWPAKGIYKDLVERVIQVIHQYHAESWVILQSFETIYLKQLSEVAPNLIQQQLLFGKSGLLPIYFDRTIQFGKFRPQKKAASVNIFYIYITPSLIKDMHKMGKQVYGFAPSKESDMCKLIHMEIDGMITNYPDRALKILKR